MSDQMKKQTPAAPKKTPKKAAPKKPAAKGPTLARVAKDVADKSAPSVPVKPTDDRAARHDACAREIQTVLVKHRCKIYSALNPMKPVGGDPNLPASEAIVGSTWGILPEA